MLNLKHGYIKVQIVPANDAPILMSFTAWTTASNCMINYHRFYNNLWYNVAQYAVMVVSVIELHAFKCLGDTLNCNNCCVHDSMWISYCAECLIVGT